MEGGGRGGEPPSLFNPTILMQLCRYWYGYRRDVEQDKVNSLCTAWGWGRAGKRDKVNLVNLLRPAHHPSPMQCRIEYRIQNTKYRILNAETHVHKITNVPVFYLALGPNDFDVGKSISQAKGRGGNSKWISPHQNHLILRHVNNRYINS